MTLWCHLPTIFNRRHALRIAGLIALCVAIITTLFFSSTVRAEAGINQTISFQGRLLNSAGGIVPDGYYNMQFKLYQDGTGTTAGNTGGTLKWTESHVNGNANGGVQVKNGYFSVNLGSKTAFDSSVDWNQTTLWLSMNVAGSAAACTQFNAGPCTADGEMLPMKRLNATPFAINSAMLEGKRANNFLQLAQGVQEDASNNTSSIFVNKTGSGNLLQLQQSATDIFTITNDGDLAFGNATNHSIGIATSGASTNGRQLTIGAGTGVVGVARTAAPSSSKEVQPVAPMVTAVMCRSTPERQQALVRVAQSPSAVPIRVVLPLVVPTEALASLSTVLLQSRRRPILLAHSP